MRMSLWLRGLDFNQPPSAIGYEPNKKKRSYQAALPRVMLWLRGLDLNQRPFGYEPNELPGCSTPRCSVYYIAVGIICQEACGRLV